jgi:hypothetical protein
MRSEQKQADAAFQTLRRDPNDPKANLTAGRFLCFTSGDWAAGLPLLTKGSDATLKALAQGELSKPSEPEDMAKVADDWWAIPEKGAGGVTQAQARRRAAFWYQAALPRLKGLKKTAAEARLAEERLARAAQSPRLTLEQLEPTPRDGAKLTSEGLEIRPGTKASTPETLHVPVRIDVLAKTDDNNLRLRFAKGELIFNWELNRRELRHHDPATGAQRAFPDQGFIQPKRWARITWVIEPGRSVVFVDGKQRAVVPGDYRDVEGAAGITAVDSTVTVKAWRFSPGASRGE